MATFILKSLGISYAIIAALTVIMAGGTPNGFIFAFIAPILLWPALLILSVIVGLVLQSINEHQ
jgi:flavin reductase (DIM6/NTAB) family NADH-FMN oxidoreductase RutF